MFVGEKNSTCTEGYELKIVSRPISCIKDYNHSPMTTYHPAVQLGPFAPECPKLRITALLSSIS